VWCLIKHRDNFTFTDLNQFINIFVVGIFFSDGPFWVEQRRFTLHHLRDLGFGKSIMEALISEEVEDVIKELRQCEVLQASEAYFTTFLTLE
jgi:methyl farnesoate epoxidase/farnesoate epoxidase